MFHSNEVYRIKLRIMSDINYSRRSALQELHDMFTESDLILLREQESRSMQKLKVAPMPTARTAKPVIQRWSTRHGWRRPI